MAEWAPRNDAVNTLARLRAPAPAPAPAVPDGAASDAGPGSRASFGLGAALVVLFAVLLPVLFYELTPHQVTPDLELGLIYTSMVISGARLSVIIAGTTIRIFETVLWIFYYLFMGIAPLVQYLGQTWPSTTPDIPARAVVPAALIVVISQLGMLLGLLPARGRAAPATEPAAATYVPPQRIWLVFGVFALAGAVYFSRIGVGNVLAARNVTGQLREASGNQTIGVLIWAITSMALLCVAVALILNWRQGWPAFAGKAGAVLAVALTLIVINPIANARYVFGTTALALLGSLGCYRSVKRFRAFALTLAGSLLLVFPSLDFARFANEDGSLNFTKVLHPAPLDALTTGDFDAFAQIANTFLFVQEQGVTWGRQLLGVLLFWVPRGVWPDKPTDTGVLLATFRGYGFTNLSAPLPAEMLINFGWIGLIVLAVLLGRFLAHLDLDLHRRLRAGETGGPLLYVLPFYLIILLRGSLLQAMSYLAVLLVCGALLRTRRPPDTA